MRIRKRLRDFMRGVRPEPPYERARTFESGSTDPRAILEDIRNRYDHESDLLHHFVDNRGPVVHKWHHYIPLYDRYLSRFRGGKTRFLEIGVGRGGSLRMWRRYFGDEAVIFGIDVEPDRASFGGSHAQVRIGSQDDRGFLESVVGEMGGLDVVIDDGSHQMAHVRSTLETLFPLLDERGVYVIEDLHAAYWSRFGGGLRSPTNFFRLVDELVDDMHHWYHPEAPRHPGIGDTCFGIHVHDSLVLLEKNLRHRPVNSRIG